MVRVLDHDQRAIGLVFAFLALAAVRAEMTMVEVYANSMRQPSAARDQQQHAVYELGEDPIKACPKLTLRDPPDDIKQLKIVDVKVVAAMGDSVTAGFGIDGKAAETRDLSYGPGNRTGATTLANFHRHYRADAVSGINVAITGDLVQGQVAQAHALIAAMKADKRVDFAKDWKLVTLFIGANNQCPSCQGNETNSAKAYEAALVPALEVLRKGMPRVLVNLVLMMKLSGLANAPGTSSHCILQHFLTKIECPCALGSAGEKALMDRTTDEDNRKQLEIAAAVAAKGYKEFGVVVQPVLSDMKIPDYTYLSTFDCFHPSLVAHQQIALGLWQNLFEPVGKKKTELVPPAKMKCPTDADFIYS